MYPSFPTQCSFVGLLDDTPTSRNQSILEKKTASHKEGLDTFQSMLEGMANAGTDVTYLKAAVTQYIRRFPDKNSAKVKDAIVDETDVLYSELNNNIAWHNASTIRRILELVSKYWNIDALCEAVTEIVNVHGLQKIYNGKCTITPYKKDSGKSVCVLGTHNNKDVHDIEMIVTDGGLDCVFYRVFLAFRGCLDEGMFPSDAPISLIYVDDDLQLQSYTTSLWALVDPDGNRDAWPSQLRTTYESLHPGEPDANSLYGCQGFRDFSFDMLSVVDAEMYRLITASLLGRFGLSHDSRSHDSSAPDQSPVPGVELFVRAKAEAKVGAKNVTVHGKSATKRGGGKVGKHSETHDIGCHHPNAIKSVNSDDVVAQSHGDGCGPSRKKAKVEKEVVLKPVKIAFDALLDQHTIGDVIRFLNSECDFAHFVLAFMATAKWGNLTPNSTERMGFVGPILTKQHRELMKRHFNLTGVPSAAEVIDFLDSSPFLRGKICVHISGQLFNPKAMIDKMCGTDVLFFKDTISTNVVDVLGFTIKEAMYVNQSTRALQNPPFCSIIDGDRLYTSLRGAVTTEALSGEALKKFNAHMLVHDVNVGCGHTHDNVAIVVDDDDEDEDEV